MSRVNWRAVLFLAFWAPVGAGACKTDIPRSRADAASVDRPMMADGAKGDGRVADALSAPDAPAASDGAIGCALDTDCGPLERCEAGRCVHCSATCTSSAACIAGAVCVHHNLCSSCELRDAGVH